MVGQNRTPSTAVLNKARTVCRELRVTLCTPRVVGLQIFEAEGHLVGIKPLGTTAKLTPLELLDDALETFDLIVAGLNGVCHVPHQCMQEIDIGRQTIKL